ncbi:unnamed protein product, partial [Symbiodinium pilosum]
MGAAQSTFVKFNPEHAHIKVDEGPCFISDLLPVVEIHGKGKKFKEFFRIVDNVTKDDQDAIRKSMEEDPTSIAKLPPSVQPGDALGESCHYRIVLDSRRNKVLVFFHSTAALPWGVWGVVRVFCKDKVHVLNYKVASNSDHVKCAFLVMLSKIPGDQWLTQLLGNKVVRRSRASSEKESSWDPSPDDLRTGIEYINTCPANSGNCQAEPEFFFPLLFGDLRKAFVDKIVPLVVPRMTSHGLILLGKPGIGETPLAIVLALAVSRHLVVARGLQGVMIGRRRPKQIDGFRERPCEVQVPVLLDDPLLVEDIKSFLTLPRRALSTLGTALPGLFAIRFAFFLTVNGVTTRSPTFLIMTTLANKFFAAKTLLPNQKPRAHFKPDFSNFDWLQEKNKPYYGMYKDGMFVKYLGYEDALEKEAEATLLSDLLAFPEEKEYMCRGATYTTIGQQITATPMSPIVPRTSSPDATQVAPENDLHADEEEPLVFRTHLCQCTCGGSLSQSHDVPATLYSMDGKDSVRVVTMRCTTYSCRATFGPNFRYDASNKINTAQPADVIKAGALFVNNKVGFSVSCLEYHSHLEFRSFVAAMAVQDVCTWPAQMPSAMLANLVQIGCPRLTAADRGWFMVVSDPTDQRILWAKPMYEPEGNAVLEEAISEILPSYKNLDGVLVDRAVENKATGYLRNRKMISKPRSCNKKADS